MSHMVTESPSSKIASQSWKGLQFDIYSSIQNIYSEWGEYCDGRDIFLSPEYLGALEKCPPDGMSFFYVVVRSGTDIAGVMYYQLHFFQALQSLNYDRGDAANLKNGLRRTIKEYVASKIQFYTLICGNITLTGSHGFLFDDKLGESLECEIVDKVSDWLSEIAANEMHEVKLLFVKDFPTPRFTDDNSYNVFTQYHEFHAQPAMSMRLNSEWKSFGDYLNALQSKYRVRARRARKYAMDLERRVMSLEDIRHHSQSIYRYYLDIARNSVFNLFILDQDYFVTLKEGLGEKFQLTGYFRDGVLVAFNSVVYQNGDLVAHFLGYDDESNRKHQIYLNMLYDIIELAIQRQCGQIAFARTALEIKSSVGAEPHPMYFYLRYVKPLHNPMIPVFYKLLEPEEIWTPRSPFKDS